LCRLSCWLGYMRSGSAERSFGTPRGTWEGRRQGHGGVVDDDIGSGRHKSIFGNHVIGRQGCYCDWGHPCVTVLWGTSFVWQGCHIEVEIWCSFDRNPCRILRAKEYRVRESNVRAWGWHVNTLGKIGQHHWHFINKMFTHITRWQLQMFQWAKCIWRLHMHTTIDVHECKD
jgi:hypothetical protein